MYGKFLSNSWDIKFILHTWSTIPFIGLHLGKYDTFWKHFLRTDLVQSYKGRVVRWGLNPSLSIYVSTAFPQISAENRTCSLGQRNYLTDIICICFANASKHLSIHLTVLQVFDQHHHSTTISANLKNWAKVKKNTPFPWAKHTGLRIVKAKGSAWASQPTRIGLLP